jgi:hypothetical protein
MYLLQSDLAETDVLKPQVEREEIRNDPLRQAFGEVEDATPRIPVLEWRAGARAGSSLHSPEEGANMQRV